MTLPTLADTHKCKAPGHHDKDLQNQRERCRRIIDPDCPKFNTKNEGEGVLFRVMEEITGRTMLLTWGVLPSPVPDEFYMGGLAMTKCRLTKRTTINSEETSIEL